MDPVECIRSYKQAWALQNVIDPANILGSCWKQPTTLLTVRNTEVP
jgi:hypothetical protein